MSTESLDISEQTKQLAAYLFSRREALLNNWRLICEEKSGLPNLQAMSREEFVDMVPVLLNTYESRLLKRKDSHNPVDVSREHGLHRWHSGFKLRYLLTEINYLYQTVAGELDLYWQLNPDTNSEVLRNAYSILRELIRETIDGSASQFDELQHLEAATRAENLEKALEGFNELFRERNDMIRTSSHDLRGSLSVVQSTAFMLDIEGKTEQERRQLVEMMNRNLQNIQTMLQQLMNLARLEAGQEKLEIETFDVSQLLQEMVESARPLADKKGLTLLADGTSGLIVKSDSLKIKRIIQNLLLNALNYTPTGVVSVTWAAEKDYRLHITVQDSGPGLPKGLVSILAHSLKPTKESGGIFNKEEILSKDKKQTVAYGEAEIQNQLENPDTESKGEGVGLYVVKRLCEVLHATLDIESEPGKGTLFRVKLPIE